MSLDRNSYHRWNANEADCHRGCFSVVELLDATSDRPNKPVSRQPVCRHLPGRQSAHVRQHRPAQSDRAAACWSKRKLEQSEDRKLRDIYGGAHLSLRWNDLPSFAPSYCGSEPRTGTHLQHQLVPDRFRRVEVRRITCCVAPPWLAPASHAEQTISFRRVRP
jgi:hypothetical protein